MVPRGDRGVARRGARGRRGVRLASSAATKADLLANPFDEKLWYNEDTEWANRRPMRRVYCPDARVEHSHDYADAQLWRRFYGEGYSERQIFGDPVPSRFRMLLSALAETARDLRYLSRHPAGWREAFGTVALAVGGLLDFVSGRIPRAPEWMRRHGVEWIHRLYQEPVGKFRRYAFGNPLFLWRLARSAARRSE